MKAAEARFFAQTSTATSATPAPAPEKLNPWLDSWSMVTFLYPRLKEGDYVWTDDTFSCLYLGTREMYVEWLTSQETLPNPTGSVSFYPLGLVLCVINGERVHNSGHTNRSNACAGRGDFAALAHALGEGKVGSGIYTTYCEYFQIKRPMYFIFDKERNEEENNFLQEFFRSHAELHIPF